MILIYSMCFVDINSEIMCLLNHLSVDIHTSFKLNIIIPAAKLDTITRGA